jgi:hypothetical protein
MSLAPFVDLLRFPAWSKGCATRKTLHSRERQAEDLSGFVGFRQDLSAGGFRGLVAGARVCDKLMR